MTIYDIVWIFPSDDLWDSLGHASKKPVSDVMNTWTKQMGFPVLSVSMEKVGSFYGTSNCLLSVLKHMQFLS